MDAGLDRVEDPMKLLLYALLRLPIYLLALLAIGLCSVVMWLAEQFPEEWME